MVGSGVAVLVRGVTDDSTVDVAGSLVSTAGIKSSLSDAGVQPGIEIRNKAIQTRYSIPLIDLPLDLSVNDVEFI